MPVLIQGQQWGQLAPFIGSPRDDAAISQLDYEVLIMGGRDSNYAILNDAYLYNGFTEEWEVIPSLPGAGRQYSSGFGLRAHHYVVGGYSSNAAYLKEVWALHNHEWIRKDDFPGEGRSSTIGLIQDDFAIFGLGKNNAEGFQDLWKYLPLSDEWIQLNDFPGGTRNESIGVSCNGIAYVGLGKDEFEFFNDLWKYNALLDEWNECAEFPGTQRTYATAWTVHGHILIYGGVDELGNMTNELWSYNPETDQWSQMETPNFDMRKGSYAFSVFDRSFITTGISADNVRNNEVYSTNVLQMSEVNVELFPNPTQGVLHVNGGWGPVSIVDQLGNEVVFSNIFSSTVTIDITHLSPGHYILRRGYERLKVVKD